MKTIQHSKKLKEMEENGEDIKDVKSPDLLPDNDYVQCPHCFRKFAKFTAERHIPKCKNILNRPRPPPNFKPEEILPQQEPAQKTTFRVKKDISAITKRLPANIILNNGVPIPQDPDDEPMKSPNYLLHPLVIPEEEPSRSESKIKKNLGSNQVSIMEADFESERKPENISYSKLRAMIHSS